MSSIVDEINIGYVTAVELCSNDIYQVTLVTSQMLDFQGGQYIKLKMLDGCWNCYSVFEKTGTRALVLLIKKQADNIAFLKKMLIDKETIDILGPYGQCILEKDIEQTVCIAQGTAIAPVYAIIADFKKRIKNNTMLYGQKLDIYWFVNAIKYQSLVKLIKLQTQEIFNINLRVLPSFDMNSAMHFKKTINNVNYGLIKLNALLYGSYDFVKEVEILMKEVNCLSVKSDYSVISRKDKEVLL